MVALEEEHSIRDRESTTSESDDAFTELLARAIEKDSNCVDDSPFLLTDEWKLDSKKDTEDQQRRPRVDDSSKSSPPIAGADSASDSNGPKSVGEEEHRELEHLAGPRCEHVRGYCGFNISPEEMKGCTTSQCLVRKTPGWASEPHDQGFEQSGMYHLSGLCGAMPPRNWDGLSITPPRHDADNLHPDVNGTGVPMPFHPTCFEIFTRACRLRTGSIDVVGLAGWGELESDYEIDMSFPHHEAVKESFEEEEWHHRPGYEWLAANPILVPGLTALLRLAVSRNKSSYDDDTQGRSVAEDPFSKFPGEIANTILELVNPVDVAALCLAGLAKFMTIENWYRLLREDMPWLWEVWDTALPSLWATTTVSALSAEMKQKEEKEGAEKERCAAREIILQELPEIAENWDTENEIVDDIDKSYASCGKEGLEETMVLPKDGTNWCRVYYEVKANWKALKGLQNRERIWRDVEEILRKIDGYRSDGRIA